MVGEYAAHYCEFAFEIISSMIAFLFCMDSKTTIDRELDQILYGSHKDCGVCEGQSSYVKLEQASYHKYKGSDLDGL